MVRLMQHKQFFVTAQITGGNFKAHLSRLTPFGQTTTNFAAQPPKLRPPA